MIALIVEPYCRNCDSGGRGAFCISVLVVIGEITLVTVEVVIGVANCSFCDSGDRGILI